MSNLILRCKRLWANNASSIVSQWSLDGIDENFKNDIFVSFNYFEFDHLDQK